MPQNSVPSKNKNDKKSKLNGTPETNETPKKINGIYSENGKRKVVSQITVTPKRTRLQNTDSTNLTIKKSKISSKANAEDTDEDKDEFEYKNEDEDTNEEDEDINEDEDDDNVIQEGF